jgi:hypothetical protein
MRGRTKSYCVARYAMNYIPCQWKKINWAPKTAMEGTKYGAKERIGHECLNLYVPVKTFIPI